MRIAKSFDSCAKKSGVCVCVVVLALHKWRRAPPFAFFCHFVVPEYTLLIEFRNQEKRRQACLDSLMKVRHEVV
ncbi:hypothetical protein BCR33DRAFT_295631 [Rhizoclosmatium globosum]|uniref:Uncharacterized protein n=1 Tax=Rhizoclosmatium globosum TaxID=329046 RepID=A0A1Y2C608_9FUNG|nr:hypothetical protein BCR33DRAFT_295631 [Rhizoclosmatium globosum]|eukprot:ORY42471.1 hypothetical protein BCR33DRAFT_295631 [Rhizoclosmatium globosum]